MAASILTIERLKEVLSYDPDTGLFVWLVSTRRGFQGKAAGTISRSPWCQYLGIRIDGVKYQAHRLAWLYVHGKWPEHQIDHINGNGLDNRIENLRDATAEVNSQNHSKAFSSNATSKLLGVSWNSRDQAWIAQICYGGVRKHLGTFPTKEQAYQSYLQAKRKLHSGCTI